jgi:hypothetical protein
MMDAGEVLDNVSRWCFHMWPGKREEGDDCERVEESMAEGEWGGRREGRDKHD